MKKKILKGVPENKMKFRRKRVSFYFQFLVCFNLSKTIGEGWGKIKKNKRGLVRKSQE